MKILVETVGPFAENSYFLVDEPSREAVAVDPGDEPERLLEIVKRHDLRVKWILNTHGHLDHVGAVAALQEATGAPFRIHEADLFLVEAIPEQAALFGLSPPPIPRVDGHLKEGDVFTVGNGALRIEVLETPGHSPGSVTLRAGHDLIVGDALFAGSIGRTDLPGGDTETLLRSIREKLLGFPDDTRVHPGHMGSTTIGRERRTNPFLQDL
jgi:hydroxyacylglutathione hydrolase